MMKHLIVPMSLLSFSLNAQIVKEGYFIDDPNHQFLNLVKSEKELTIDHVSSLGYELYGPDGLKRWLEQKNISFSNLETGNDRYDDKNYISVAELQQRMQSMSQTYSNIMQLQSIGKTTEGREILIMKISDNPKVSEIEPKVKYIANMHGNEIVGRELMMKLIEDIAKKYQAGDQETKDLVNNTEIYIMPTLNPDGNFYKRRGNANYTDLNRSFPDFTSDNNNTTTNRPPEVKAIMEFQTQVPFALSANFHDGAVVINYPWDTAKQDPPLVKLIEELSSEYASHVPLMYSSQEFPGGITNGYAWYEVDGGMQDWSYYYHNDLQITVELSYNKWPAYSEIANQWRDNYTSLYRYLQRVHQGAGVSFKQSNVSGKVTIKSTDEATNYGTYAFNKSQFYKVLPEGSYKFMITPEGKPSVTQTVEVSDTISLTNGNYIRME